MRMDEPDDIAQRRGLRRYRLEGALSIDHAASRNVCSTSTRTSWAL